MQPTLFPPPLSASYSVILHEQRLNVIFFVWSCALTQGQESDSSEASVRGPRIKHVCRRAAVALGRNRAVFPDDMPTLSALPWEEREKILSSMGNDGEALFFSISIVRSPNGPR